VPGSRVAINLTGLSKEEVRRGDVVTSPGWLQPTTMVDCQLRYLADAPQSLKHNAQVDFFSGAAEARARVRLLGAPVLEPGEQGWVQLRLEEPVALVKGDRFIIRQPSPSLTVGGGTVINPFPGRRHRRFRPEVIEQLETQAHGSPQEILLQDLERQQPCQVRDLLERSSLGRAEAQEALQALVAAEQIYVLDSGFGGGAEAHLAEPMFLVTRSSWGALRERLEALLRAYHNQYPLRIGMPREEVKSRLQRHLPTLSPRLFNEILSRGIEKGWLAESGGALHLASHQARFTDRQQQSVDHLLAELSRNPYLTPSVAQCEEQVGADVINALLEQGRLIKLSDDVLFLTETYEEMRDRVVDYLREHETITVAQIRDLFGTSRKYALALAGHLDEKRITRRVGDERTLR